MSVPLAQLPVTPLNLSTAPIIGYVPQLTSGVTLTAPTTATLVTGLTAQITVPAVAQYIGIKIYGQDATVTAAATVTQAVFTGATTGALTTQVDARVVVAPTGGTTVSVEHEYIIPVTPSLAGTTFFVSLAATASTGNFVLNAGATTPTTMFVVVY